LDIIEFAMHHVNPVGSDLLTFKNSSVTSAIFSFIARISANETGTVSERRTQSRRSRSRARAYIRLQKARVDARALD